MTTSTEALLAEDALSLFIGGEDKSHMDSSTAVTWCISKATAAQLQAIGAQNPQLLIVITNDEKEVDRYIVPLKNMMKHIRFRRPGKNIVHATIVWPKYGHDKDTPKNVFSDRYDTGSYTTTVVSKYQPRVSLLKRKISQLEQDFYSETYPSDGQEKLFYRERRDLRKQIDEIEADEPSVFAIRNDFNGVEQIGHEAQIEVIVPKEMFAKDPPRWMKWLGTRFDWWPTAAIDQCDLRRRALITGFVLPPWLVLKWTFLLIAGFFIEIVNVAALALCLLFGLRGINMNPLIHPFEESPVAVFPDDVIVRSIWIDRKVVTTHTRKDESTYETTTYEDRNPVFLVLNPASLLIISGVGYLLYWLFGSILNAAIVVAAVSAGIALIIGVRALVTRFSARSDKKEQEKRVKEREKRAREREQNEARLSRELELLACSNNQSHEVKLSALPRERRTVSLRLADTKAKVCRPFAQ